jgi:oligosaccharide 4-alpha-D-glucosyltransferase
MKQKLLPYFFLIFFFLAIFFLYYLFTGIEIRGSGRSNQYLSHQLTGNVLVVKTSLGTSSIRFLNDDIAEVSFSDRKSPFVDSSHAVILKADNHSVSLISEDSRIVFKRKCLEIHVSKNPYRLCFIKDGDTVLQEKNGFFRNDTTSGFRFALQKDEKIYGTGFRTIPSNRRGYRVDLYNKAQYGYGLDSPNLNFSVPLMVSSGGYAILFDNPQKGFLDIGKTQTDILEFGSMGGKMAYYVMASQNPDSLMSEYGLLTGFQPMPPRWALGNLQSRFGYKTQKEAEEIVGKMLAAGYPLDAIIIDLYWFGQGVKDSFNMGNLMWEMQNWPDAAGMISKFKTKGVKTILITEPYILEESVYFDFLGNAGMLASDSTGGTYVIRDFWFGKGGLLDIFNPKTQDWFWEKYNDQIKIGVAGWWGDLGEPETAHPDMFYAAGAGDEVHNIYAHYWNKMLSDGYTENYPDERLFHLNRVGFAGSQRFSVFTWSGDVSRSWQGLQAQPRAVMGMTLSGFSYMHSDLGGFAGGEKDEELYIRWLQYGTFNPVFRVHGDDKAPVEPIFYSKEAQINLKKFINLRYQMLPYNYTLTWLNSSKGEPITRPLFFEEPDNPEVAGMDDTYLWGPGLLVAPILEKGQKSRKIYLPKGNWFDFFSNEKYEGGRWIEKPVTLENIPVFARGGSFIPMIEPIQNTEKYSSGNLILHYYVDEAVKQSGFTMYEDDGKTKNAYEKGLFELLDFNANSLDDLLVFSFEREKHAAYAGMPKTRTIELVIHNISNLPGKILVDDKEVKIIPGKSSQRLPKSAAFYNPESKILTIKFGWEADGMNVQLKN